MKRIINICIIFTLVFSVFVMGSNVNLCASAEDSGFANGMEFIWEAVPSNVSPVGEGIDRMYRLSVKVHVDSQNDDGMESFTPDDPLEDSVGRYVNMFGFAVKFDPDKLFLASPGTGVENTGSPTYIGNNTRALQLPTTDKFTTDGNYASDRTLVSDSNDGFATVKYKASNQDGYTSMMYIVYAEAKKDPRGAAYGISEENGQLLLKDGSFVIGEIYFRLREGVSANDINSATISLHPSAFGDTISSDSDAPKGFAIYAFEESVPVIASQAALYTGFPRAIKSLAVKTPPKKMSYIETERLSLEELSVDVVYEDEPSATVNMSYEKFIQEGGEIKVGAVDANNANITKAMNGMPIVLSLDLKSVSTSNLTVASKEVVGIQISSPPEKLEYSQGRSIDLTGMVVTATYNGGNPASENIPAASLVAKGYNLHYGLENGTKEGVLDDTPLTTELDGKYIIVQYGSDGPLATLSTPITVINGFNVSGKLDGLPQTQRTPVLVSIYKTSEPEVVVDWVYTTTNVFCIEGVAPLDGDTYIVKAEKDGWLSSTVTNLKVTSGDVDIFNDGGITMKLVAGALRGDRSISSMDLVMFNPGYGVSEQTQAMSNQE